MENEKSEKSAASPLQKIVMWRGSDGMTEPVKVECPDGLYPNNDADGMQIFENTHFRTEESAWQNIEDCILAGISLSGSAVEYAQSQLRQAERQAADSTIEYKIFRKAKTLRKMQDT